MKQIDSDDFYAVYLFKKINSSIKFLRSKWLLIVLAAVITGVAGVLYAWFQKPSYTAELVFSTESGAENAFGGYAGLAAQFGFDFGIGSGGAFEGDNLIELLSSNKIIMQTLLSNARNFGTDKLMIDAYLQNHDFAKKLSKDKVLSKVRFTKNDTVPDRGRDSIMKVVYKNIVEDQLTIDKKDKKLNYIVVKMKDVNEVFAKDFVETLVNNAAKYYTEYRSKKATKNFQLISKLTDSVKALLYGNIENYASSNDLNVNPLRQIVKTGSQKIQVNAQANTALYTELLKQLGVSQITLQKETPLIQIIDEPVLPLKKEKLGRLKAGIIFSFLGFFLVSAYLLIKRQVKVYNLTTNT